MPFRATRNMSPPRVWRSHPNNKDKRMPTARIKYTLRFQYCPSSIFFDRLSTENKAPSPMRMRTKGRSPYCNTIPARRRRMGRQIVKRTRRRSVHSMPILCRVWSKTASPFFPRNVSSFWQTDIFCFVVHNNDWKIKILLARFGPEIFSAEKCFRPRIFVC